jgi:hypothetical protein
MDIAEMMLITAAGFVDCMGSAAVGYLRHHAEIEACRGDWVSEKVWSALAEVAAELSAGKMHKMN